MQNKKIYQGLPLLKGIILTKIKCKIVIHRRHFLPSLVKEGVGGGNSLITTSLRFESEHSSSIRRRKIKKC